MAIRPKTQLGIIACLCCGHDVPAKAGENGTVSFSCPWCDFPAYAKAGTEAHRIITGKIKKPADPDPVPAAKATLFG
jgi:hypothetical protein